MKRALVLSLLFSVAIGFSFGQGTKRVDPCAKAQTQADLNDCWGKQYQAADAVLNQSYRQLVAMLDDEEKSQLKAVETAWLKYRDANCEFVADQYKGGTMRPMAYAVCLDDMTRSRTAEIRTQIKERNR